MTDLHYVAQFIHYNLIMHPFLGSKNYFNCIVYRFLFYRLDSYLYDYFEENKNAICLHVKKRVRQCDIFMRIF